MEEADEEITTLLRSPDRLKRKANCARAIEKPCPETLFEELEALDLVVRLRHELAGK